MNKFISPLQILLYLAMIFFTWKVLPLPYVVFLIIFTHNTSLVIQHHLRIKELERKLEEKE